MTKRWLFTAAVVAAAAGGCGDRTHLSEGHGRSYRLALARQAANPNAGSKPREIKGLDPQEAAIIARSYRRALAGAGKESEDRDRVLILTGPKGPRADEANMPPPSVPQQR